MKKVKFIQSKSAAKQQQTLSSIIGSTPIHINSKMMQDWE